jgi:hypothetical protein
MPRWSYRRRFKADILRGEHRHGHTVTFAEYAREWVESYQGRTTRGFREATRSDYRRSVEKAIPWFSEHCPKLSDAEPRDMRLYVANLQKDGRSLSTVRNHLSWSGRFRDGRRGRPAQAQPVRERPGGPCLDGGGR